METPEEIDNDRLEWLRYRLRKQLEDIMETLDQSASVGPLSTLRHRSEEELARHITMLVQEQD
jgi:hypothetical protein